MIFIFSSGLHGMTERKKMLFEISFEPDTRSRWRHMSEKERIPICNCLEWDSMINIIKKFSPKEKYREFVRIIKILVNVMSTRTSGLINEHSCIPKSSQRQILSIKSTKKNHDVKQRSTKSYQLRLIIIFANLAHIVPSCKARKHACYYEDANNGL